MNVFKKEMKANVTSLIIWCCAQVFIIYAGMMKYQGFADSNVDMSKLMAGFPKEIMLIFGVGSVDLTKVAGFYSVFFLYFMLLAAIHAVMFGAVAVSREERDHCADFLYTKPIRRFQIIMPKLIAGVINILIFNMVTFGASVFFISLHNNGDGLFSQVSVTMLALFILQLFFLALGAMFGAVLKNTKLATSVSGACILGFFLVSVAVDLYDKLAFLEIITPFKYFEGSTLMIDEQLSFPSAVILLIVSLILFTLTFFAFNKRDLKT
ncbi:ABC transporter permease subunit [Acetobacterium fimetarium]|uniref:ABC transporter permease subunit n=1 Tax=Acetobacterium fimetarium TaxID=52691 RepID=A0ABR6WUU8_9FIRM|nr:ABC transporter permease subunit [Acetobacterium fimetarium]MBC3804399.1 ABC transporter permease subunit [Acetobacterium fimetarium]